MASGTLEYCFQHVHLGQLHSHTGLVCVRENFEFSHIETSFALFGSGVQPHTECRTQLYVKFGGDWTNGWARRDKTQKRRLLGFGNRNAAHTNMPS